MFKLALNSLVVSYDTYLVNYINLFHECWTSHADTQDCLGMSPFKTVHIEKGSYGLGGIFS